MRKNFGVKPLTYPQPVYIIGTYDENGVPDAMNAAWGGISGRDEISFCLGKNHKTVKNLKETGEFTCSMGTEEMLLACDFVGIASGNTDPEKFVKSGFHAEKSPFVNAPLIEELPLALECRVKVYDDETGILRGEILNVSADTSILTDGNIDAEKLSPIIFDPAHLTYRTLGKEIGKAFSDGKALMEKNHE